MRTAIRVTAAAAMAVATTAAAAAIAATPAFASVSSPAATARADGDHAVFVQTDNTAGNRIVVYHRRGADGTLSPAGSYATGGRGGILDGSVVDHPASQGSLGLDTAARPAVLGQRGQQHGLGLRRPRRPARAPAGAGLGRHLPGQRDRARRRGVRAQRAQRRVGAGLPGPGHRLVPLLGSHRALGLDPTATPQFTTTPGQVAFTPDGSQLVVTTKANGNDIDVFAVGAGGRLSATAGRQQRARRRPVRDLLRPVRPPGDRRSGDERRVHLPARRERHGQPAQPGGHRAGRHLLGHPGRDPSCTRPTPAAPVESRIAVSASGQLSLLGNTATGPGTVDAATAAVTAAGSCTCRPAATAIVDEFSVAADGALTKIGAVIVPGAVGGEGIVAS